MSDPATPGDPEVDPPPDAMPHTGTVTMLPAGVPGRPRRPASFWVLVGFVGVLLIVAIALPLALKGRSSAPAPTVGATAARARGVVPRTAVFAASNNALPDLAAVVVDARALLAGGLPAASVNSAERAALTHPPAPSGSPMLGADLDYGDPQLPNCLAGVTGGDTLYGIDRVNYVGQPSLLVVTADTDSPAKASAYVIGTGCALPGTGIRTFVSIPLP